MAKVTAEVGSTANSYQILAKLAVGGMAEIFLARGASVAGVERYCVLKRILRERAADAQFARMFLDEARLAAQLQHPNIAAVYDIGMLGDSYFFTMEYVHGETVRSLVQRAQGLRRPVPLACALTIIAGAAAGLHHAHERNAPDGRPLGIVHRDVSPSNLMVSYEGNVKVVDFGVAKAANRAVETSSGTVKGKISYLSPEQCRGAHVDRRSDLFSLGIVMWEMLTGARLYRRASDFESMTAIVHETPSRPSLRRAEVPRAVDDIVLRLLAGSVADRFQTAAEVVEAIENASMRAGTILSTSAVSRLMRDLFGMRAEPWLELDADAPLHEPLNLVAQPIPLDGAQTQTEAVDRGLAGVPDLRPPGSLLVHCDDGSWAGNPQDATLSAPNTSALPVLDAADAEAGRSAPRAARIASGSSHRASPGLTSRQRTVLGTAAALAAIAVWFAMRDDRPSPDRSGDPAPRAATVEAAAIPIEPPPAPVAPERAQPPAAPAPARTDPEPAQPPPAQIMTEARGAPRVQGERSPTPVALSSPTAPPRRAPPSTIRTGSPPTTPTGAMGPTSATGPTASNAPRTSP
ncbi:MAG TPA: serine/threonine-protein kinase, partial [Kofleriaceae bacterium]